MNLNILVDGLWGSWAVVGTCDAISGLINRTRACDSPPAWNGGDDCTTGVGLDQVLCTGNNSIA